MRVPSAGRRPGLLFSSSLAAVLAATLLAGCGGNDPAGRPRPRAADRGATVLLVTIDTLRADRVGCYGRPDAGTPALDGLAAGGARFDSAHTTAPVTLPAHSSILTGRTLPAHGVLNNATYALPDAFPTLAERFRGAGYATGAFVSTHVLAKRHGLARGFDRYDDEIRAAPRTGGRWRLRYGERPGAETAALAADWLKQQGDRPAFLWVHFFEPHAPHTAPPEIAQRYPDTYQAEVATADLALAGLLADVRATGRERLLVVVAADHGEGLWDHGEQTHGIFLYQEVMRVPLVVWGPAFGVRPAVVRDPVSLADVAPTLAALTDLPPLDGADGLSLAAAITGAGPLPARAGVFADSAVPRIEHGWSGLRAMVSGTTKLIDAPRRELYDIAADPGEKKDLARARPADVERAGTALADLVRAASAAAPEDASAEAPVTEEHLATLRSLGYAATGRRGGDESRPFVDPRGVDPKDRVEDIRLFDLALTKVSEGKPQEAIPAYRDLVRRDPANPGVRFSFARAQIMIGDLDGALENLKEVVALDPGHGTAWFRLGQIHDARKEFDAAKATYRRACQVDPLGLDQRKALGSLLAEHGERDEALKVLEEAARIAPDDPAIARDLQQLRGRSAAP